jgi:DNA topoisomerase-3
MQLIIAEKPSMARAIADTIGISGKGDGYINCKNGITVTWCFGHLLKQAMPDTYLPDDVPVNPKTGNKKWRMDDLPIVPDKWKLETSKESVKQFKVIKALLPQAAEVVNAGDPDREGQLLVDEILTHLNYKGRTLRLWVQALDKENIEKALRNLKDNKQYRNFMLSALGRSRADWLVGLNLTRAYTVKSGRLFTVGRVQTPTLNLVVERDIAIENFKPKDYYGVWAAAKHVNGSFTGQLETETLKSGIDEENRLIDKALAERISQAVKGGQGRITDFKKERKLQEPPMPFMLSSLQKFASSAWGWSAKKTLDTLQSVYEKKLVSYPRTDCPYLSEEDLINAPQVLAKINSVISAPQGLDPKIKHKCWNSKKITAHTGIVPTKDLSAAGSLNSDEKKLYDRIILSFYLIFMPPYEYYSTSIKFNAEGYIFSSSGSQTIKQGFKSLLKNDETTESLPDVKQGDSVVISDAGCDAKKTAPPARFTDGTLVDAMSHIHKYISDAEAKKVLKETDGIGTEATRANIIEELVNRKYIERNGKQLISTPVGREMIKNIPSTVKDPILTAKWESALSDVAEGKLELDNFISGQIGFISDEIDRVKGGNMTMAAESGTGRAGQATSKMLDLAKKIAKDKGLKLKGKDFEYIKKFIDENIKGAFKPNSNNQGDNAMEEKLNGSACPKCGGDILIFDKFYKCSNSKYDKETKASSGCDFIVFKTLAGKKLSDKIVSDLLLGRTVAQKGFTSKAGKPFDAKIGLDDDYKVKFIFD